MSINSRSFLAGLMPGWVFPSYLEIEHGVEASGPPARHLSGQVAPVHVLTQVVQVALQHTNITRCSVSVLSHLDASTPKLSHRVAAQAGDFRSLCTKRF